MYVCVWGVGWGGSWCVLAFAICFCIIVRTCVFMSAFVRSSVSPFPIIIDILTFVVATVCTLPI